MELDLAEADTGYEDAFMDLDEGDPLAAVPLELRDLLGEAGAPRRRRRGLAASEGEHEAGAPRRRRRGLAAPEGEHEAGSPLRWRRGLAALGGDDKADFDPEGDPDADPEETPGLFQGDIAGIMEVSWGSSIGKNLS